ncbi:MAG: tetratricopeptide repeat protein [Chthoniobacterales bacterium]
MNKAAGLAFRNSLHSPLGVRCGSGADGWILSAAPLDACSEFDVRRSTFDVRRFLPLPLSVGRFPSLSFGVRPFLPLLLLLIALSSAPAQTITLQSGQKIETQGVRRDGEMVMGKVQVGTGSGEVGYHLAQIQKVEFPEPGALKSASDLLVQGQPDKAAAEIEPVVAYYAPFKDVPGNWWAQAALIKVSALAAQQHPKEAEALASDIEKSAKDQDMAHAAQLRLIGSFIRANQLDKAIGICDATLKSSTDPTTLANAWIAKGDTLLAQKDWDEALLAYLHVPVFYQDEKLFQPAALLGSGRAYRRLNDTKHAKKALNDLVAAFPQSAEAAAAQTELKKL